MQADERVNSFEDLGDLSDLKPKKTVTKKPSQKEIDNLATSTGFTSRQSAPAKSKAEPNKTTQNNPMPRRTRLKTGRNIQLNLKVTEVAITKFYEIADEMVEPLGEVFEQAINALIEARSKHKK